MRAPPASGLRVTWMGHSSMLVEIDGVRVLVDPVWDERASPVRVDGAEAVLCAAAGLEELPRIDAVLVSHDHYRPPGRRRRCGGWRVESMRRGALGDVAGRGGDSGAVWGAGGADHGAGLDGGGVAGAEGEVRDHFLALAALFRAEDVQPVRDAVGVVCAEGGAGTTVVYFGADSGWWEGFAEIGAEYGPFDLTMLEIGALQRALEGDSHGAGRGGAGVPGDWAGRGC